MFSLPFLRCLWDGGADGVWDRTPLNKIAEPEEVAIQVAFLASHRVAGHTTGQIVMIHGGMEGMSSLLYNLQEARTDLNFQGDY
jgi:NAD(P)-dependent dehydrogenase (short-subunit alcohol dehydrogenase family)